MPDTWIVDKPQIIDLESIRSVRGNIIGGRLNIIAHDSPTAHIEILDIVGRPLEISLSPEGDLSVSYPFMNWDHFSRLWKSNDRVDISIAVPRSVSARLGTVTADGLLSGVHGPCNVKTVSGTIVVDRTRGPLIIGTVSGNLDVRDHDGTLKAASVSGSVTASGNIATTSVKTVSGQVALDLGKSASAIRLESVSADMTVRRPAVLGVKASMNSLSGRVLVDDVEYAHPLPGKIVVDRTGDDGSVWIEGNSVSGNITVLTAANVPAPVTAGPRGGM